MQEAKPMLIQIELSYSKDRFLFETLIQETKLLFQESQ